MSNEFSITNSFFIKTAASDFRRALDIINNKVVQGFQLSWNLERVVGFTLGGTYLEHELPDANIEQDSPWGIMKHAKTELIEEVRANKLVYSHHTGTTINFTTKRFKHRSINYWKHSIKLDTPIQEYHQTQVLSGQTTTLYSEKVENNAIGETDSIKAGIVFWQ